MWSKNKKADYMAKYYKDVIKPRRSKKAKKLKTVKKLKPKKFTPIPELWAKVTLGFEEVNRSYITLDQEIRKRFPALPGSKRKIKVFDGISGKEIIPPASDHKLPYIVMHISGVRIDRLRELFIGNRAEKKDKIWLHFDEGPKDISMSVFWTKYCKKPFRGLEYYVKPVRKKRKNGNPPVTKRKPKLPVITEKDFLAPPLKTKELEKIFESTYKELVVKKKPRKRLLKRFFEKVASYC